MKKLFPVSIILIMLAASLTGCTAAMTTVTTAATTIETTAMTMAATETTQAVMTSTSATPTPLPTPEPTPTPLPDPSSVKLAVTETYSGLTFDQPLLITTDGSDSNALYVVERTGKIKVFADNAKVTESKVFLDLSSVIISGGQEQGLLGLAFHPDYAQNGYIYVNYTNKQGTVIARFTRSQTDIYKADPESGVVLLTFPQPYTNHNGGCLAFGPDGYLYIATGDGGSKGDPRNNAQNLTSLLGKILRIDVDNTGEGTQYAIPANNPFAGNSAGNRPEIYAYGLRNPWRFSFDSQGQLWAGDVGQDAYEEIDIIQNGGNYGWSAMEGKHPYNSLDGIDIGSLIPPVLEYKHNPDECVTGGYVYAGDQIPALRGTYIYGDYVSGRIWSLWIDEQQTIHNDLLLDTKLRISSFGLDANNEILITDLTGKLYRLTLDN